MILGIGLTSLQGKFPRGLTAWFTGGTETEVGLYRYHTFTSNGTLTFVGAGSVTADILVVGGGGGAGVGNDAGGGGGGGSVLRLTAQILTGTEAVVVGGGGNGGINGSVSAGNGVNSSIAGNIALGGGRSGQGSPST